MQLSRVLEMRARRCPGLSQDVWPDKSNTLQRHAYIIHRLPIYLALSVLPRIHLGISPHEPAHSTRTTQAHSATMTEIWDDDNDFDLSDGAFEASHAASTSTSTSIENGTVLNAATKEIRANQVQGDASTLAEIDGVAFMIPFDPFKCTEINEAPEMSSLSKEEQDQGSANSVKTVRGCADSAPFSESSTSSDNLQSSSACATDLLGITAVVEQTTTHIDDDCHPIDAPTTSSVTLRKSSSLSRLLALSASGPGRVRHLGSTPHGAAKSVLGGWDEDLNLDGLASGLRPLRAKSSFTSHISDDLQDDELETGLPTPQSTRKVIDFMTDRADLVAFKEQEDAVDPGNDFDLPDDQRSLAFSPTLARPSSSSLGSIQRRSSVAGCSLSEPLSLPSLDDRRGHRHLSSSPALTHGNDTTTTEDELTEDENFFDDIVLPARLLGGPGALTPPPEDEKSVKLSLQALLKHNLEIRRGRGLDKTKDASAALANARLAEYREVQDDDTGESEYGLVLEPGIRLGKDRIHSRPRPQLQGSLKDRRSSSTSAVTPSSCAPKTAAPLRRHATLPAVYSASNLTNSPAPTRQGSHRGGKNVTGQEKPISPSESEDLPSEVSTVAPLRFRRLTAKVSSSNQSPSLFVNRLTAPAAHPATKTLSRKSSANSLLSMRSQTLERKRSLQEIGSRMPFRQTLRSPSPASSVTNAGPRPGSSGLSSQASFAAPTASSMSRVRERVMSSPMIVPPSPVPFVRHSLHAPPRPSSAASGRFSQPTLASASKVRGTPARSISTPVSGLRIPAIPLHLARPRSAGDFGDGTELDGFDDLPTDRLRERERTVSNATARQARLSGVESARLGSGSRRAQNGSSSSTSSGASAVRKRLAESGSVKNKVDTQLGSQASDTRKTSAAGKDKPRKRKREPQLIRNLSGVTASKSELRHLLGSMALLADHFSTAQRKAT